VSWKVAQAKQQFSEVLRLSAREPQAIYNRDERVAVLVSAAEYDEFQRWRAARSSRSPEQDFAEVRALLEQAGVDGIELSSRSSRANSFLETLGDDDPR
jgi:prevent-host-death family protein